MEELQMQINNLQKDVTSLQNSMKDVIVALNAIKSGVLSITILSNQILENFRDDMESIKSNLLHNEDNDVNYD